MNFLECGLQNGLSVAAIISFLIFCFGVLKFIDQRRRKLNRKEYEQFHKMIRRLVRGKKGKGDGSITKVDEQIAVLFELRHLKRYFPVSLRILRHLRNTWGTFLEIQPELRYELEETILFLERKIGRKQ
jgi:hypothetical protein